MERSISNIIPPNYSVWQTIELTHKVATDLIKQGVQGDFVECGVAAGNNFGAILHASDNRRTCIGFDSFQGIPHAGEHDSVQPGIGDIDPDKVGLLETTGVSSHSVEVVRTNLKKWKLLDKKFKLIEGWFQDTIPQNKIEKIALLRLDGDLYESTAIPLQYLIPKMSIGGVVIIDDWNLIGPQKAWSEVKVKYQEISVYGIYGPKYFKIISHV
jgi:O-methyltransferase